jgi:hypothetical protein
MNIKTEQKKEYLKPQMSILEYEVQGSLLDASTCDVPAEANENDIEVDFIR